MKRISLVILAFLLALTTVLAASCVAPPEENTGTGNKVGNGGSSEGTDASTKAPEETDAESTDDEGTEKEEESALPETEPMDKAYLKAMEALTVLDEDTKNEIAEVMGCGATWLDYEILLTQHRYYANACCYGEYNGCVVFLYRTPVTVEMSITIADYEFFEGSGFWLYAFYNGTICSLGEAYENGTITNEDLEVIIENYETLKSFGW